MTREEAIRLLNKLYLKADFTDTYGDMEDTESYEEAIKMANKALKQEPKIGYWEYVQYDYNPNIGNWHCSECRNIVIEGVNKYTKGGIPTYNYCPNCGSKMIKPLELQGSEEKE